MPASHPLTESLRRRLKAPLGTLVEDSKVTKDLLASKVFSRKDALVVCIGDRTTERMIEMGYSANLEIVDKTEKRKSRSEIPWRGTAERVIAASNPAGSISQDSLAKLRIALDLVNKNRNSPVRLEIVGEEDLLALPVIAFYPEGSFVLYGQPGQGLVIVDTASQSRRTCIDYLIELGIISLD